MSSVHSKFGGSIISVVEACPGYIEAIKDFYNETNAAAEKGTAYHECAEHCERIGLDAEDVRGTKFNGYDCDDDMVDSVQTYLNYIRSLKVKHPDFQAWVEGKVTLSSVAHDVYGYADHLLYSAKDRTLYVTDLKGGFILVDVEGLQTPYYGIGALDTFKLWFAVDKVVCTIHQPRTHHAEGTTRSRTYTIEQMYEFRDRIVEAVRKARQAGAPRIAGAHCTYCQAAGICRPRMERTVFLSTLMGSFADLTNDELATVLKEIPTMEKNFKTLKEYANRLARGGSSFDGFKLVKPIVHSKCEDEDALIDEAYKVNPKLDKSKLYNPGKLRGKSILKPILGKDSEGNYIVDKHFRTPEGNTELVPLSNPRPAIGNDARGIFSPIED